MKKRTSQFLRKVALGLGLLIVLFFLFELLFRPQVLRHSIASGHYSLRRFAPAEKIWSKAADKDDGDHIPESSLGKVWYKRGDFAEAEKFYSGAVQEQEGIPGTRYDLGNALYRNEKLAEALEEYKAAMLLDPQDQDAKSNYELVLNRQGYKPPPPPESEEQGNQQEQEDSAQEEKQEQYRNTLDALDQKEALDRMARRKSRESEKGGKWW